MERWHRVALAGGVFLAAAGLSLGLIVVMRLDVASPLLGAFGVALLAAVWTHENIRVFDCPACEVPIGGLRWSHWHRLGEWLGETILECSHCRSLVRESDHTALHHVEAGIARRDLGLTNRH